MRGSRGQHRRWVWHLAHAGDDGEQEEAALRGVIRWWPRGEEQLLMKSFASLGLIHGMRLLGGPGEWRVEIRKDDTRHGYFRGFVPTIGGVCEIAARYGQLEALDMALAAHCQCSEWALYYALRYGAAECAHYLHATCPFPLTAGSLDVALRGGSMECVQYVRSRGHHWTRNSTVRAAQSGAVALLQYVIEQGGHWNDAVTKWAARAGNIDILRFAIEYGCSWHPETTAEAAREGHIEILRFAAEHDCPWSENTTAMAATRGARIEGLQYARATPRAAATYYTDALRFVYEHGCSWDDETVDVVRFVAAHGCPWAVDTTARASAMGDLDVLQFVLEHGCPMAPDTALCAFSAQAPAAKIHSVLVFLQERGAVPDTLRARIIARWGEGWEKVAATSEP